MPSRLFRRSIKLPIPFGRLVALILIGLSCLGAAMLLTAADAKAEENNFAPLVDEPTLLCAEPNPYLVVPCYVNGDPVAGGSTGDADALVAFRYKAETGTAPLVLAKGSQIGATWGVAYAGQNKTIYVSAFLRRHVGFGPSGPGAIYAVNVSDMNNPQVSLFLDLETLGVETGAAQPLMRDLPADRGSPNADAQAFPLVAKYSLGDIDINEAETTLYVMNLFRRQLVAVDVASRSLVATYDIPNPGCGNPDDVRPFGVKVQQGQVYVGVVCSAQSTQNAGDLSAHVLRLSGDSFNAVLSFPLNYDRKPEFRAEQWRAWSDQWNPLAGGYYMKNPQPIFSDIEFTDDGSLILGFLDRWGAQTGSQNFSPNGPPANVNALTAGEILYACKVGEGWEIEGSANCPKRAGGGPNGSEFFQGESLAEDEASLGALALMPGTNEVVVTSADSVGPNTNGVTYMSTVSGDRTAAYTIRSGDLGAGGLFDKGHGLGDIELLCDHAAPPEPPTPTPTESPTETPEEPTPTPEVPTATPEQPTATPELPTPTVTPEQPTATLEEPTATPELPTPTQPAPPEAPTATPELPTPEPTPTEPCTGDECDTPEPTPTEPCTGDECDTPEPTPTPVEPCTGDECATPEPTPTPTEPCTGDECATPEPTPTPVEPCTGDECATPEPTPTPVEPCTGDECATPEPTPTPSSEQCVTGVTGRLSDVVGAGIPAWTISVQSADDPAQRSVTVTDGTGSFAFDTLTPGRWVISYELQGGWQAVSTNRVNVLVEEGAGCSGVAFTIKQTPVEPTPTPEVPGCLIAYHQQDYRSYANFPGAGTWQVVIYPADRAEPRYTATTDSTGYVNFANLTPGTWIIEQVRESGAGNLSQAKLTVTVPSGPLCMEVYIGVVPPPIYPDPSRTPTAPIADRDLGCISGQVIDDEHFALPGWTVLLKPAAADAPILQTTSDGTGAFHFRGLQPGRWVVWQNTPAGWNGVTATTFEVTVPADPACVNVRFKNRAATSMTPQ